MQWVSNSYESKLYEGRFENLVSYIERRPGHYQNNGARQALVRCWTDLGIQRVTSGQYTLAAEAFREALRLDPSNGQLQRNLAAALEDAQFAAAAGR